MVFFRKSFGRFMLKSRFHVSIYFVVLFQYFYFIDQSLASDYANLTIEFTPIETLKQNPKHIDFTRWIESIFGLNLTPRFETTSSHGFITNETHLRYAKNISALEHVFLRAPSAQQFLFPNVDFYQCSETACQATQDVSPLLPTARYTSHYQWLMVANVQELDRLRIPLTLFQNTKHFPKYLILQLATDWSQYFYRAASISVFEPNGIDPSWIYISSYQTVSLTRFGSFGKGSIKSALEAQIHDFIAAFSKL